MLSISYWRLKQKITPDVQKEVIALKKLEIETLTGLASELVKDKSPEKVIKILENMVLKINKSRVRIDGDEEDKIQETQEENEAQEENEIQENETQEDNEIQQILTDYCDYMRKQLTEEIQKLNGKLT